MNKVSGQPFTIAEIETAIEQALAGHLDAHIEADKTQLPEPVSGYDDGSLKGGNSPQSAGADQ